MDRIPVFDCTSIDLLDITCKEKLDLSSIDNLYASSMEMKDWIRAARAAAGLTQDQLGERLGVTKGNVSAWENGRHEPSYNQVRAISVLSGKPAPGEQLRQETSQVMVEPSRDGDAVPEGYVRLSILDATAYMGAEGEPVDFPEVIKKVDVLKSYLQTAVGGNPDNLDLMAGRGDSMSTTINHGDLVFVDRTVRAFDSDGIYVIVWQDGLMIKRLQAMPGGGMCIMSDNARYKNFDLAPAEVGTLTICARVHGKWGVTRF